MSPLDSEFNSMIDSLKISILMGESDFSNEYPTPKSEVIVYISSFKDSILTGSLTCGFNTLGTSTRS